MSDAVLVLNAGSSSIKFGLFDISGAEPRLLCKGLLDEHEDKPGFTVTDAAGNHLSEKRRAPADNNGDALLADILDWSNDNLAGGTLAAIGHRVVHGGRDFDGPAEVTDKTIDAMAALTPLAPLHQPRCLSPIRAIRSLRPDLTQIACFDTAFHHGLVPPVSRFAIPRRFEEMGIRRYGFHGLSFEFIANHLAEISPILSGKRTVAAHLGNGASLCAMRNGRSVDTTMGLTPLDGLMMGTRGGAIDPGVLIYLQQQGMSVDDLQHMLYQESGLLGISGLSADMRVLLASHDPRAAEAIELFTFRVAREVSAMANTLGGLECLVFTGGIGEHSAEIRQQVCELLQWLGVRIDHSANDQASECINTENSGVDVRVIPTSEETMIARHCSEKLRSQG
ncbi:acetate/propionate family kinase [Bradyrhizobium sp. AUGA SZCCT0177]|uniref:acetate/propionate family kinase n=1 Tax=Bradyrhizobium sp. AUGA SZCCT0177 TaxID=2807665 RepID=UPI001BA606A4|nr:acetate/propionate family kinase [Bradyrhizobium sp. AUGA SZCCT0177]MBR1282899.1 acetate/propionate family kinase [Bradyrhizobium sp. AUGA SZCCT0177]